MKEVETSSKKHSDEGERTGDRIRRTRGGRKEIKEPNPELLATMEWPIGACNTRPSGRYP